MSSKMMIVLFVYIASACAKWVPPPTFDDRRLINRPTFPKPYSPPGFPKPGFPTHPNPIPTFPRPNSGPFLNRRIARDIPELDMHHRARRSPQDKKGSVVVTGSHTKGQYGQPSQQSVRGEYNHNLWRGKNGATVDANAYYQRNWGGGPRQDYGGGVRATIPFGRR